MSGIIYIFDEKLSETVKNPDSGSFFVGEFFRCTEKEREPKRGRSKTRLRRKRDCDAAKGGKNCLAISAGLPFDRPKARRVIPERPSYSDAKFAKVRNLSESPVSVFFRRRFYSNGMPVWKGICHRINKIKKS